jgi:hypothetical protein
VACRNTGSIRQWPQPLPEDNGVQLVFGQVAGIAVRVNNRIQVFDKRGRFQREFRVETQTLANGAVWDMVLSPDSAQTHLYVADGTNGRIYILRRSDGEVVGNFGRTGTMAGEFKWIHNLAIDAKGNLYTSEVGFGRRAQKFEWVNR